jgi:hypothetical protein
MNYQLYRRSVLSAMLVEDNELLTVQEGMAVSESIEGYCLDSPDVLPTGGARRSGGYPVLFMSRRPLA